MTGTIEPGSTIGVLGSGQLGRMFAAAARRMGYRVHVFSPDRDTPAGQWADVEVQAPYDDLTALADFARRVDVVTFEFENIPAPAIEAAARHAPVRPGPHVLHTSQHRLREKTFLRDNGLPVTGFQAVRSLPELQAAVAVGLPAVIKTASWGYDGKGQAKLSAPEDAAAAWAALDTDEAILEQFVDFECEVSVVCARGEDGEFVCYDACLNDHQNHILDVSVCPAGLPPSVANAAVEIAREVMDVLQVVGVLCVEFFVDRNSQLLINELAPRPHNSGHLTIDAHLVSQFEQQVRAVCGLPLGSTSQLRPAAMANLLGDCWQRGQPSWARALALPDVALHLYGKSTPLPGRKMGHLTALAETPQEAARRVRVARESLLASRSPVDACVANP